MKDFLFPGASLKKQSEPLRDWSENGALSWPMTIPTRRCRNSESLKSLKMDEGDVAFTSFLHPFISVYFESQQAYSASRLIVKRAGRTRARSSGLRARMQALKRMNFFGVQGTTGFPPAGLGR